MTPLLVSGYAVGGSYSDGVAVVELSTLPATYPGSSVVLNSTFLSDADCWCEFADTTSCACDTTPEGAFVSIVPEAWSGSNITIFLNLPFDSTPLVVFSRVTVSLGNLPSQTFSLLRPEPLLANSGALLFHRTAAPETGIADLALGILPATAFRPNAGRLGAAVEHGHDFVLSLPARFRGTTEVTATVNAHFLSEVSLSWKSSAVTVEDSLSSRLLVRFTALYGELQPVGGDGVPALLININNLTYASALDAGSAADEYVEVFSAPARSFAGPFHRSLLSPRSVQRTYVGVAPTVPPQPETTTVTGAVGLLVRALVSPNALVSSAALARLQFLWGAAAVGYSASERTLTGVVASSAAAAALAPAWFSGSTAAFLLAAAPSFVVAQSAMVEVVELGVWSCAGPTGALGACGNALSVATVCGRVTVAAAAAPVCTDRLRTRILESALLCALEPPPPATTLVSTEACGEWLCTLDGVTGHCGLQHAECMPGCEAVMVDRRFRTGAEPGCWFGGSRLTDAAAIERHCPLAFLPRPVPVGDACVPRSTCTQLCGDRSQPMTARRVTLVPCDAPNVWSGECVHSSIGSESRAVYCVDGSRTTAGAVIDPLSTAAKIPVLCEHLGVRTTTRPCYACSAGWQITLTYSVLDDVLRLAFDNPILAFLPLDLLLGSAPCVWDGATRTSWAQGKLECACISLPSSATAVVASDVGATPCASHARDALSRYMRQCRQSELLYMCNPSGERRLSTLVPCEGSAPDQGFTACSDVPGCGVQTRTRVVHCILLDSRGTPMSFVADPALCEIQLGPAPVITSACPRRTDTCIATVPTACIELGSIGNRTHTCDASVPGGPGRVYVGAADCVDGRTGLSVSDPSLCFPPASQAFSGRRVLVSPLYVPCYMPKCGLGVREFRWVVSRTGDCYTDPHHRICRTYAPASYACETRMVNETGHSWVGAPFELCTAAGLAPPVVLELIVPCGEAVLDSCASISGVCTPIPRTIAGVSYPALYGECACTNGRVGYDCTVDPAISSLAVTHNDGDIHTAGVIFRFATQEGRVAVRFVTLELVRFPSIPPFTVDSLSTRHAATVVVPAPTHGGDVDIRAEIALPKWLQAGEYTVRVRIAAISVAFNASSVFFVDAACTGMCGAHGRCNTDTELCNCDFGFGGGTCADNLCLDAGCPVGAENGLCVVSSVGSASCRCHGTFTGLRCQFNDALCVNEVGLPPCANGGHRTATTGPGAGAIACGDCICTDSWTGSTCQNCPKNCANGGALPSGSCGTCNCPMGFGGDDCSLRSFLVHFIVDLLHVSPAGAKSFATWTETLGFALVAELDKLLVIRHGPDAAGVIARNTLASPLEVPLRRFAAMHYSLSHTSSIATADLLQSLDMFDATVDTIKAEFERGALGSSASAPLGAIVFSAGLGLYDPLCVGVDCPRGVGNEGTLAVDSPPAASSSTLSTGGTIAIACGSAAAVAALAFVVLFIFRRRCSQAATVSPSASAVELATPGSTKDASL